MKNSLKYLVVVVFGFGASNGWAQTPILQYQFNDSGTTTASTGSNTTSATFELASTPTDLHSAAGQGVSGSPGDLAFNNTSATAMGGTGGTAVLSAPVTAIESLDSFTLVGWFKTDGSEVIGSSARLFAQSASGGLGFALTGDSTTPGKLDLSLNGTAISSAASYTASSQWEFFAVTYDGTITSANVKFYIGSTVNSVSLVSTVSLNKGTEADPNVDLAIGGTTTGTATFDGLLDDMSIYGSSTDNTGVLTQSQLETIRFDDLTAVPEPSTIFFLAAGGVALCVLRRNRMGLI
jgi:Concanavalin A-like lectin/glucanases superfamily/PEP-CTERM motif